MSEKAHEFKKDSKKASSTQTKQKMLGYILEFTDIKGNIISNKFIGPNETWSVDPKKFLAAGLTEVTVTFKMREFIV